MFKRWSALLLCLMLTASLSACAGGHTGAQSPTSTTADTGAQSATAEQSATESGKLMVSVTFHALAEFTSAVGGDQVQISTIIPDGMEAHDFEPKAQDLAGLGTARVFVYNGLGMETWAEKAISAANNKDLIVVDASEGADVIVRDAAAGEHEEDAHTQDASHDEEGPGHGKYDPHLWLGIRGAQTEVQNICDALVEADPANRDYYENNCKEFIAQLEQLYNEYHEKFESLVKKNFVTGHAAFGYLCRDFGLTQNSISDIFAEGEPSAQQLAKLVDYCRANGVTTIFAEDMANPDVSATLAREVGARVETIYTMETREDGLSYLERMADNLFKIYDSLT